MRRRQQSLVWCQYIFLALGLLALGYCAKSFTQAWLYQRWALPQMTKQRSYNAESIPGSAEQPKKTSSTSLGEMSPIGRLEISRVHISAVVAEGTSQRVLSRAIGHAVGTALPGQTGNVTLAAHRDTFFRHLGDVRSGDIIDLKEPGHEYRYQVRFTAVVGPKDTWVLATTGKETLTLLTCYPFHFVGPAPDRFVIRARRIAN
jgi:sortase A